MVSGMEWTNSQRSCSGHFPRTKFVHSTPHDEATGILTRDLQTSDETDDSFRSVGEARAVPRLVDAEAACVACHISYDQCSALSEESMLLTKRSKKGTPASKERSVGLPWGMRVILLGE